MNRRQWMMLSGAAVAARGRSAQALQASSPADTGQDTPDKFLLKDYRPKSIYKVPITEVKKAKYPAVDVHCHGVRPLDQFDNWIKSMDDAGIEKTVIFTGASTAEKFKEVGQPYAKDPKRFDLWCSFNLEGADQPGFGPNALKALEDCHRLGAIGVGEIGDKGTGMWGAPKGSGLHPDDPRMDALWNRCAQLGMPINIHVSDPIWAYEPMDRTNDGLMESYNWMIKERPGLLGHNELIESLERAVAKHPKTIFIACHFMNLDYDLTRLDQILERNPNLYCDISARFESLAPIPISAAHFIQKHQDRVLYGTDLPYAQWMFSETFRILETHDEHFYVPERFIYHWPLHGFGLPDAVLKKVYGDNARRAFEQARKAAQI
jgi:hypothetical protein